MNVITFLQYVTFEKIKNEEIEKERQLQRLKNGG